jgi:hypothetical protein
MHNISARSWGFILPAEWPNVNEILKLARELSVKHYYILHDSDFDTETGELKKAHYHVIMSFKTPRKLRTISNYFSAYEQFKPNSFEKIRNINGAKRYLIHLDDGDKHRYDVSEVVTNDKDLVDQLIVDKSKLENLRMMREAYKNPPATLDEFLDLHEPMLAKMNTYQGAKFQRDLMYDYEKLRRNGSLTAPPTSTIVRGGAGKAFTAVQVA